MTGTTQKQFPEETAEAVGRYLAVNLEMLKSAPDHSYEVSCRVLKAADSADASAFFDSIILEALEGDAGAWQASLQFASERITAGRPMPSASFVKFIVDVLANASRAKPPRKRGRIGGINWARDAIISRAVDLAIRRGELLPTRNSAARDLGSSESACSLIARQLLNFDIDLSESAVEKIWRRTTARESRL